jgi:hypothetical protein
LVAWHHCYLPHAFSKRDLFEELKDNVDGAVKFTNGSLKPMGSGTIMLKLPRFPYFLLHNVIYLLEL